MRHIHTRDAYRPKSYTLKIFKEALGIEIYIVDREVGGRKTYEAVGWTGKQQIKPAINHYYRTPESRQEAIERTVRGTIEAYQRRRQRIVERNQPHDFQVGDILTGSWGYDQTNVEFFQVIEVPSAQYVVIRELAQRRETTGYDQGNCEPAPDTFIGEPLRRKVIDGCVRLHSSCRLSKWDGRRRSWSSYH